MKTFYGFSLAGASLGVLTLSLGLSLVACGGDSSSGNDDKGPDGISQYESKDDLIHCTKSHYGELAYVTETDSIYECTGDGWVVADSSKLEDLLSSSDSKSESKSSSSIAASAEDTAKVETVKVDSVTVLGLAEKGPFAKGSVVNVYGLDSALNKTKTSFKGTVNDDKGNYSVSKIKLSSQYALVEVNGFFNNEMTGKKTSGSKTKLRALVDLSEGDTVKANVNILTDMEYERAVALVKKEKYNVPAAKVRATRELLAAFGVDVDSVSTTSLSLAGDSKATNGLFAASVAMMGKLTLSKFHARLADAAKSFAETGAFSDTLRAEIADELCLLDSNGTMASVSKNIVALNSKATGAEKLVYSFWTDSYNLPACTEKNEETIVKNENKLSANYGAGFVCTSKRWHKSTALDTELGLCVAKNEGSYESTKAGKYYTCKAGQWREISKDQYTLGACTEDIAKDVSKKYKSVNKKYFVCKDLQWEEITADEYELKDCNAGNNEKIVKTKTSQISYVCVDGAWRMASAQEETFGYCSKVDSTEFNTLDNVSYACLEEGWTSVDGLTAELGFCTEKISEKKLFKTAAGESYNCIDGTWKLVDKLIAAIGKFCEARIAGEVEKIESDDMAGSYLCVADKDWTVCGTDNENEFNIDYNKVCQNKVWRDANAAEKATGKVCSEDNSDEYDVEKGLVCQNKVWRDANAAEKATGKLCVEELENMLDENGYVCIRMEGVYGWRKATEAERATKLVCPSVSAKVGSKKLLSGSIDGYDDTMYDCTGNGWVVRYKTGSMVDSRTPTKIYKTVTIGTQTWMAENLNYAHEKSICRVGYCDTYGRLYTWDVAMGDDACMLDEECRPSGNIQGICPVGWHLPTKEEWSKLIKPMSTSVSGDDFFGAGVKLKTVDGWIANSGSSPATDAYAFSALPAGYSDNGSSFSNVGSYGYFWTASESSSSGKAYHLTLSNRYDQAYLLSSYKSYRLSVRCVKD